MANIVGLDISDDISKFRSDIAKIPAITAEEARRMVAELKRSTAEAEAKAKGKANG